MTRERIKSLGRKALVADDGSFESTALSGQGGVPLGLPGESWPDLDGEPLFPVLTVDTRELPSVPEFLSGHEYWSLFASSRSSKSVPS